MSNNYRYRRMPIYDILSYAYVCLIYTCIKRVETRMNLFWQCSTLNSTHNSAEARSHIRPEEEVKESVKAIAKLNVFKLNIYTIRQRIVKQVVNTMSTRTEFTLLDRGSFSV